jgi:endonuclease YncB( thermonuclease family)
MERQRLGARHVSLPPPPPGFRLDGNGMPPLSSAASAPAAPPPPPGFQIDQPAPKAPTLPPLSGDIIVRPVDGDTAKLSSGQNLRLWGVDAPELMQQGWDRSGRAVPIGQQSRDAFGGLLTEGPQTIGSPVGMSFRRPVAPIDIGGKDAGLTLARNGNALAAPDFLAADPQRRFEYMQAERLARLNGLGIHDTKFQPPADYRKAPLPTPSRETVAQWWDTPTPMAGMRPEVEQTFLGMVNDAKVPVEQVVRFSKENGFITDPADVKRAREQIEKTGLAATAGYKDYVRPLTDQGDGALGAYARGVGSGALASGLDEAGAFVDMLGGTEGRENVWNSDRRLADIWSNNQQQNASILGFDDFAHPYATVGGELTGGLLVPFGARAKTVGELARVGAAYGGATGFLGTEGSVSERAFGAALGVPMGAALGVAGGKLLEFGAPRARKLVGRMFGRGFNDTAPTSGALDDLVPAPMQEASPPPPPGFRMDDAPMPMAAEPSPSISQEMRQPDYLAMERPQPMGQPLSEAQVQARASDIQPRDVLPTAASEEWPAAPDFAGNINLGKLDTPQDISRALTTIDHEIGFDAATRGRVTQEETARLAADLNMTPETLMARRQGQAFNAEEALAARQVLAKSGNELVNAAKRIQGMDNPGDELLAEFRQKLVRHVAIQEQVAGATAEAGRALAQFRMMADSRAVRGNVLSAMVRGGGGKDTLQDVANVILDAQELEPGKFNALIDKALKPTWKNKLTELYVNFLLSFPQTHAVNITSNTLTALAQVPEHAAAAAIGKARQVLPRADLDRITGTEVGQRMFGLVQGAKEGARLFSRALRTGEPADFISKVEGQEYKAIPGIAGEVVRTPTRLLTAEDEFFKGIARRMELNGIAARMAHKEGLKGGEAANRIADLVANPTDEMLHSAEDYGRYVTFQSKLGPFAQGVSNMANSSIVTKFFLPFIRTPTNLLKFATERSPAAPLLAEWRKDYAAGGARRDLAMAKALVGTGFGAAMYEAAQSGTITGAAPSDPKKARLLYADGWKPYSVKVGDTYYSYARLDPFSSTIGVAADMATLPEGMSDRQKEDKATLLVASILGNLANKTWLSGATGFVEALSDPERNADNMMQRLVGSLLVPNIIAGTARTLDPTQREVETMGEALKARIPGMRETLLPRRDIWGKEIRSEGGIGPDFLSPSAVSTALNDPVNKALLQLSYAPGYPSKKIGDRELTPQEYDRYVAMAGQSSHQAMTALVSTPQWGQMDDEAKEDAAAKVVKLARQAARAQLFGGPAAKGAVDAPPPPPPGFSIDGASGGVNVYQDLQSAIPGVQFTSGYRTPEYQDDLRRRGYRPAYNSAHLDGSALDMLPPPGKSMEWLREQVRQKYPQARQLIHDGHLHTTFPGYFGAPVLGGAKGAGLRNPLEGMPPPPPGFNLDSRR